MKVLGLDPSTTTGWVFMDTKNGIVKCGECAPKYKGFMRVQWYYTQCQALLDQYEPALVVIEGYGFANHNSLALLVEIGTALRLAGKHHPHACPWVEVSPGTLKKFVTGSGTTKKNLMMLEIYKRWDFDTTSDNIADAYALAQMGVAMLSTETDLPKFQKEALTKIRPVV